MFVDGCAIVSLFTGEDTAPAYDRALHRAHDPFTSPMAAWEAIIVLSRLELLDCAYSAAAAAVIEWLAVRGVALRETGAPEESLALAVKVAERHGIGRRALSNFDCFHFAHARIAGVPLLTLDRLLGETDVATEPGMC